MKIMAFLLEAGGDYRNHRLQSKGNA